MAASYHLRLDGAGNPLGVWKFTSNSACRIDLTNAQTGPDTYFCAAPGETVIEALRRQAPNWFQPGAGAFQETTLKPGEYYPRMVRPHHNAPVGSWSFHNPAADNEKAAILRSRNQILLLAKIMSEIFQTVEPVAANMNAYGSNIRNLLLLASMEAEAQCKGILRANGISADRMTTNDYVKLLPAMRLAEYAVSLAQYPWLPEYVPFGGWQASHPTSSLDWYNAYNQTKHDRERHFGAATLGRAIKAICANVVLLAAQYGPSGGLGKQALGLQFQITRRPIWPAGEVYTEPFGSAGWKRKRFPFA